MFQGASNVTIQGGVTSNNTSGDYINQSHQEITHNYGAQNVVQTNYVNSNNDYSRHHHQRTYGPQTTVNNVNSNNTNQTSYVNSNNDNSNTMYGGDWRDYSQHPQQRDPQQGWPPQGPVSSRNPFRNHSGMTQGDPRAGGYPAGWQADPNQRWNPDHPDAYQQPDPERSKRPHRRPQSNLTAEHYQQHSRTPYVASPTAPGGLLTVRGMYARTDSSAELSQPPPPQHVQQRPVSYHAAPAPNSNSYGTEYTAGQYYDSIELPRPRANDRDTRIRPRNADLQQYYSEQIVVPQTSSIPAPRPQEDGAEPSEANPVKVSKKEKQKDKGRKGKKPLRASVETVTDDDDDHPPANSKDQRAINDLLRPVLEKLSDSDSDSDDDYGGLLKTPPPRTIRPAAVPPAQAENTSTYTATSTMTSTQGAATQRPHAAAQGAATSQSAGGRPGVVASASAPLKVPKPSAVPSPLASTSTNTPALAAPASNSGSRVPSRRTTEEAIREAVEAIDLSRISSTLSSSDEGKDKKKKKKGVLSRMFGKKKDKGGVVGADEVNLG
ncbi:hypothetical protein MD484_g4060, partial [Candolleomyces efflorescens]